MGVDAEYGQVVVRKATRSDYLAIAALDRAVWLPYPNGAHLPDGEHTWRHWVADALVYALCENETIAGAALAFPRLDGAFWLHKIFTAETARGKGGGRLLMQAILAEIDQKKADCYLTVNPANERAVRLYRSLRFESSEVTQGYYRADEPRYEMRRRG